MSMTWAIGLALGFSMITFNKIVHCHGTNLGTNIRIVQKIQESICVLYNDRYQRYITKS